MNWKQERFDIEPTFDEFVRGLPRAGRFEDFYSSLPAGVLSADYYFSDDNVIGELKSLDADQSDSAVIWQRLAASFCHFGYSQAESLALISQDKIPTEVSARVFRQATRSIIEALKKANKQIRSSKKIVGRENTRSFIILANNKNYGMNVRQILGAIVSAFHTIEDKHVDAIIYTTGNVHHDDGTDIAKTYWTPIYNVGSESFADWINPLGRAWLDHLDKLFGPSLERSEQDELDHSMLTARPIRFS